MNTTDNLLPCPFCGAEAVIDVEYNGIDVTYGIHCPNCHCANIETGTYKKQEAIAIWNHRYEPPNEPLTIDELKQMKDEPVYLEDIEYNGKTSCWAIVGKYDAEGIEFIDKYCDKHYVDYGSFDLYGKTWIAYRKKPERKIINV